MSGDAEKGPCGPHQYGARKMVGKRLTVLAWHEYIIKINDHRLQTGSHCLRYLHKCNKAYVMQGLALNWCKHPENYALIVDYYIWVFFPSSSAKVHFSQQCDKPHEGTQSQHVHFCLLWSTVHARNLENFKGFGILYKQLALYYPQWKDYLKYSHSQHILRKVKSRKSKAAAIPWFIKILRTHL